MKRDFDVLKYRKYPVEKCQSAGIHLVAHSSTLPPKNKDCDGDARNRADRLYPSGTHLLRRSCGRIHA